MAIPICTWYPLKPTVQLPTPPDFVITMTSPFPFPGPDRTVILLGLFQSADRIQSTPHIFRPEIQQYNEDKINGFFFKQFQYIQMFYTYFFNSSTCNCKQIRPKKKMCVCSPPTDPNFWHEPKLFYGTFSRNLFNFLFLGWNVVFYV